MKGSFSYENDEWVIKIKSNTFDKRSIERMHKLLDAGILEVKETIKISKVLKKAGFTKESFK